MTAFEQICYFLKDNVGQTVWPDQTHVLQVTVIMLRIWPMSVLLTMQGGAG